MTSRARATFLVVVAVAAAVAASIGVSTAAAGRAAAVASPPNGIYTCAWIAAHPAAAAQARVTCDPSVFNAAQAGALASPTAPAGPDTIDANGCQPVPNGGGRVGKGVFAWSTYEYANQWVWSANYGPAYYTWYLKKTDNTTYAYGLNSDTNTHDIGVPANIYRWGAQNHSATAQAWYVCWNDG